MKTKELLSLSLSLDLPTRSILTIHTILFVSSLSYSRCVFIRTLCTLTPHGCFRLLLSIIAENQDELRQSGERVQRQMTGRFGSFLSPVLSVRVFLPDRSLHKVVFRCAECLFVFVFGTVVCAAFG